jgi:hypothetical protein
LDDVKDMSAVARQIVPVLNNDTLETGRWMAKDHDKGSAEEEGQH